MNFSEILKKVHKFHYLTVRELTAEEKDDLQKRTRAQESEGLPSSISQLLALQQISINRVVTFLSTQYDNDIDRFFSDLSKYIESLDIKDFEAFVKTNEKDITTIEYPKIGSLTAEGKKQEKRFWTLIMFGHTRVAVCTYIKCDKLAFPMLRAIKEMLDINQRKQFEEIVNDTATKWIRAWEKNGIFEEKEYLELDKKLTPFRNAYMHDLKEAQPIQPPRSIHINPGDNLMIPSDKISELVYTQPENLFRNELIPVRTSPENATHPFGAGVMLNAIKKNETNDIEPPYDELTKDENLKIMAEISPYDREVQTAVLNLYLDQNEIMTISMIARKIYGTNIRITPQIAEKIKKSLIRQNNTVIYINTEQPGGNLDGERNRGRYKKLASYYRGRLLEFEIGVDPILVNGQSVPGEAYIHIFREPILYTYASTKRQVLQGTYSELRLSMHQTDENRLLRNYIYIRVKRKTKKKQTIISYQSIYNYVENHILHSKMNSRKRQRVNQKIKEIFDQLIENKAIRSYKLLDHDRKEITYKKSHYFVKNEKGEKVKQIRITTERRAEAVKIWQN